MTLHAKQSAAQPINAMISTILTPDAEAFAASALYTFFGITSLCPCLYRLSLKAISFDVFLAFLALSFSLPFLRIRFGTLFLLFLVLG